MYPLLLKSPVKDYLWGGQILKREYGVTDMDKVAEAIATVIKNGDDGVEPAKKIIAELTAKYPLK